MDGIYLCDSRSCRGMAEGRKTPPYAEQTFCRGESRRTGARHRPYGSRASEGNVFFRLCASLCHLQASQWLRANWGCRYERWLVLYCGSTANKHAYKGDACQANADCK